MAKYTFSYSGLYQKDQTVYLVRNLNTDFGKGAITINSGTKFVIVEEEIQSMTTPSSFITYTIKNDDYEIYGVPEWLITNKYSFMAWE